MRITSIKNHIMTSEATEEIPPLPSSRVCVSLLMFEPGVLGGAVQLHPSLGLYKTTR